jgi:crotonobetainyl-CoA:carnitine CoA-transferase CaiB-like acyl-CoA transferase
MTAALDGMRVLDLTSGVAGPYATKLLADHGAEVVKVEAPGGDPSRHHPPFFRDKPHVEGSLRFLLLNTNKRSVVLDLDAPADVELLRALVARADALIEDARPRCACRTRAGGGGPRGDPAGDRGGLRHPLGPERAVRGPATA